MALMEVLQYNSSFNVEELWYATGNSDLQNECLLEVGNGGDLSISASLGPIISISLSEQCAVFNVFVHVYPLLRCGIKLTACFHPSIYDACLFYTSLTIATMCTNIENCLISFTRTMFCPIPTPIGPGAPLQVSSTLSNNGWWDNYNDILHV